MVKLSELGKDLVDGVPTTKLKDYLKTILSKKEISIIEKHGLDEDFDMFSFFKNIEGSFDLEAFVLSIYKDHKLNYTAKSEEEIKAKIYQNIINVLVF